VVTVSYLVRDSSWSFVVLLHPPRGEDVKFSQSVRVRVTLQQTVGRSGTQSVSQSVRQAVLGTEPLLFQKPTKKLNKSGVLRGARLNHSCVQDALLEIENRSLHTITGDVLTLTGEMSHLEALIC